MATISFKPIGSKKTIPVYLRLSISRETNFRVKTGYTIDKDGWSKSTNLPKKTTPELKNLNADLETLRLELLKKCNEATTRGIDIDKTWVTEQIDLIQGKKKKTDLSRLVNYFDYYISKLPNRVKQGGTRGLQPTTISKYKTVKRIVEDFEKYSKAKFQVKDVNLKFIDDFSSYLRETEAYSENYTGRLIKSLKTVCRDARIHDIEASTQLDRIKGYTVEAEKIYLTVEELEKIDRKDYEKDYLENTKDWLIIGCYTGQRVSDLLALTRNNLTVRNGVKIIELKQKKTGTKVAIPVHKKVEQVLSRRQGNFPCKISDQRFNDYLKVVARLAGLTEMTKGAKNQVTDNDGIKRRRKEYGTYPKWELVSSHICRRSFATNMYGKYSTPLLMNVTGHTTERQFLEYIGKSDTDYALQLAESWEKAEIASGNEPQLNVV